MVFKGARLVVLCSFLVHFTVNADLFLVHTGTNYAITFVAVTHGVSLLIYPLLGLLADTCFSRYKFIKYAVILLSVFSFLFLLLVLIMIILATINVSLVDPTPWYFSILFAILVILTVQAIGMFEAAGIQFGLDQMVEATSFELSGFIHWYYWSMNICIGVMALVGLIVSLVLASCTLHVENIHRAIFFEDFLLFYNLGPMLVIQTSLSVLSVLILLCHKRSFNIEPAGQNPFRTMFQVLRYSWKHKVPQRRSAFTYWEDDIPARIDLGKMKYGGPFTNEEVEDVKTCFKLLCLLLTLFGFHLADDGYSVMKQLHYKFCPISSLYSVFALAPNLIESAVVFLSVPLFQFVLFPYFNKYIPNMLHRIGIGFAITFFQDLGGIIIGFTSWDYYDSCPVIDDLYQLGTGMWSIAPIGNCWASHNHFIYENNCTRVTLFNYCSKGDELFLWLVIPILGRALGYHLVFMTTLEFICAQAPLKMKGLTISIWYALSSSHYFMTGALAMTVYHIKDWLIVHGAKAFIITVSLILYCCVAKHYTYRQRDEIVNEQYLVEEIYDRELRLADEYEQNIEEEQRLLFYSSSSESDDSDTSLSPSTNSP